MALKLITLNIEGDNHLNRAIPFLQSEAADVVCVQELFEADIELFEESLGMKCFFAPMSTMSQENKFYDSLRGTWGVGYFTTLRYSNLDTHYYKGSGDAPIFTHPYDNDQVCISATVEKAGRSYIIATTHFTWSPAGKPTPEQETSFMSLKRHLDLFPELILCGDFNAPRGGRMFGKFNEIFTDALPLSYTTTIDKAFHYAGDLQLVVDTIFYRGNYSFEEVKLVDGVSDHMAVVGLIT